MIVMGLNTHFEHPAVVILSDGKVAFAAEDERFTRIKHGRRYTPFATYVPVQAMHAALRTAGLHCRDIDIVASSYSRRAHFKGLIGCLTGTRLSTLYEEISAWFSYRNLRNALRTDYAFPIHTRDLLDPDVFAGIRFQEWRHHDCHAASAFYCSGFSESLVVVCDGSGELNCTTVYRAGPQGLQPFTRMPIPHSLGIFYTRITAHLGFQPFVDEFKVMGLASYGKPRFADNLRAILQTTQEGSYRVDINALGSLESLLGPPRVPGADLEEIHQDIARSAQLVLEETLEHVIGYHLRATGMKRLCLAGGTFMNCVANGRLAALGLADEIYVQPAAHDAGTALGAAALSWGRDVSLPDVALGTEYTNLQIQAALDLAGVTYTEISDQSRHVKALADELARDRICALFRGRMEFGSRALGQRSILASPRNADMRARLNRIKGREGFRPVAPMVTQGAFERYFDGQPNEYMMFTVEVREEACPHIPACVHVDGTARPQVVNQEHTFLNALLVAFEEHSGHPVLVNTSFNTRGKPIVETPNQALACFFTSELDVLSIGNYLVLKT